MNGCASTSACRFVVTLLLATVLSLSIIAYAGDSPIIGSWQLVKRKLPDGTIQTPPIVGGMSSTTVLGVNHKNVFWQTPDGKRASLSSISAFQWTDTDVSVTSMYSALTTVAARPRCTARREKLSACRSSATAAAFPSSFHSIRPSSSLMGTK